MHHSSSTSGIHYSLPSGNHGETSGLSHWPATPTRDGLPALTEPEIDGNLMWLECGTSERYLLVEDADTGDVLMPLFYLKSLFKVNYSRKVANLHHRLVEKPPGVDFGAHRSARDLYWLWAFESPQNIKAVVRSALRDASTASGHLRLVLLPVVYNAMQAKEELRATPLFSALSRAMRRSTYFPLLQPPAADSGSRRSSTDQLPLPAAAANESQDDPTGDEADSRQQALFNGPQCYAHTAHKYMSPFRDTALKRSKQGEQQQGLLRPGGQLPPPDVHEQLRQCKAQCTESDRRLRGLEKALAATTALAMQCFQMLRNSPPPKGLCTLKPGSSGTELMAGHVEGRPVSGAPGCLPYACTVDDYLPANPQGWDLGKSLKADPAQSYFGPRKVQQAGACHVGPSPAALNQHLLSLHNQPLGLAPGLVGFPGSETAANLPAHGALQPPPVPPHCPSYANFQMLDGLADMLSADPQ